MGERTYTGEDIAAIKAAVTALKAARAALRRAGADRAARAVIKAQNSVEGALRHAQLRADRARTAGEIERIAAAAPGA